MFSLFKKKSFFSEQEKEEIAAAIKKAEKETSGEVRVYIESKNYLVSSLDRSKEIFFKYNMQQTAQRNAVLIYIAVLHKEVAVFADEGIYQKLEATYWQKAVTSMVSYFKEGDIKTGLVKAIATIGETLQEKFPCSPDDKNELPDDIIFGK
ncbi:TPM domain-containing protein [Ferruginibacter albus]|uniref:TPM domain-containing protein n=1 Tax=Ferruginibacter albus TaxID=2875540 RepID=UPI001CC82D30|nr:TPM domain-containing protein [Ferruginibacter albus]UAY52708.1 TPM domain-containing protein [Ferruginibacter albus]